MPAVSDSFDEIFHAHYPRLARLLYRVTGDPASAEELAAEAFWKLHQRPPSSRHNLPGWLCRTGLRLAFDSLKMQKRRAFYESRAPLPHTTAPPDQTLAQREEQLRVRQALSALKPEQSSLLLMRSEGFTLNEIALALDLNPSSVGTFLARAEAAFRKEYVKRYGNR